MKTDEFHNEVLKYRENLQRYAAVLTKDPVQAEDLLQDTFLLALTKKNMYHNRNQLGAWLTTIMRNAYINDYRRKQKMQFCELKPWTKEETESPDTLCHFNKVMEGVNKLKGNKRRCLKLYASGYKYEEISEETGIPLGTVKSSICLARRELKKIVA